MYALIFVINLSLNYLIQNQEMATPFLDLKNLTGFGFPFTKVLSHFRELVLKLNCAPMGCDRFH